MSRRRILPLGFFSLLAGAVTILSARSLLASPQEQSIGGQELGGLTVVDGTGKEHRFLNWKFVAGTRHLSWLVRGLVDPKTKPKKVPPAVGPEALEFTEGKTAPPKKRVVSFLPLASIRRIEFDDKKNLVAIHVAVSEKETDDVVLHGVTGYKDVNHFIIEAVTDLGDLGKGTIRFQRGAGRGLQSARFSAPKPMVPPPLAARTGTIRQSAKNPWAFMVVDLQAIYITGGGLLRTSPTLYFKDTVKLDLDRVSKITAAGSGGIDFDVTLKGGQQSSMVLLDRPKIDGKQELVLLGLVGRFAAGYRFFPMATIGELQFHDEAPQPMTNRN